MNQQNVEQKDGTKLSVWFFIRLFLGVVLILKAGDGYFPIFEIESYTAEAQSFFNSLSKVPSVGMSITALHFILGTFILWNALVPIFVGISLPIFLLAVVFEFLYGTAMIPQVLAIMGLVSCIALLYHYRGHYTDIFQKD